MGRQYTREGKTAKEEFWPVCAGIWEYFDPAKDRNGTECQVCCREPNCGSLTVADCTCLMDQSASQLADLVERYYALLYRYAYRLTGCVVDAEDLTQHTFLTAYSKWNQLKDETKAKSWLFTIARNAFLKDLRGPGCVATAALDEFPAPSVEPGLAEFDSEQLQSLLNGLPEEFRSPVILFYFEEFSYKEIAEQMDVPLGTVMSRLARAKAFLRERLTTPRPAAVAHRRPALPLSGSVSRAVPHARAP